MMFLDIAKFYGIIGRKKMKSIWEPLARHCSFIPSFFFQQILNTVQDIAVNSDNPGFYGAYILVGKIHHKQGSILVN